MQCISNLFIDCQLGHVLIALYDLAIDFNRCNIRITFNRDIHHTSIPKPFHYFNQ